MKSLYQALVGERADLRAEGSKLLEKAERTGEDAARVDEITARLAVLNEEIAAEERRRDLIRGSGEPKLPAQLKEQPEQFQSLGEQLLAIRKFESSKGTDADRRLFQAVPLGLNVGQPSDGGFLMQQNFVAGLWQRAYEQGAILSRCFKVPIGDNADSVKINAIDENSRAAGSRWGGVRQYWVAEGGTITVSQGHVRQITLEPKKEAVLMYATSEMLRNPTALEAMVNAIVPQELVFGAENAIFAGDGAGKPLGLTVAPCLVTQAAEVGQLAATVVLENISKMWSRLWAPSRRNAVWLINQDVEPQFDFMQLNVGTGGMPVYMPPGGISQLPYGTLKGRPVIPIEYASSVGTVGDIVLADLSQYVIADRGGVQAASSIHVQFLTDQTAFRFTYEIDGEPWWDAALTPHSGSANTLSPFVALATR